MPDRQHLKYLQGLPLDMKIMYSNTRIKEWLYKYKTSGVYVSFSGGKDSTVLLDLVRKLDHTVPAVFCNTGLEYPEIQRFVKTFDNVTTIYPKMKFYDVVKQYGYPIIGKEISEAIQQARIAMIRNDVYQYRLDRFNGIGTTPGSFSDYTKWKPLLRVPFKIGSTCCKVMKKSPLHDYSRKTDRHPFTGQQAAESLLRTQQWIRNGCNAFDAKEPVSNPLSFWTETDILEYIATENISICSVYGEISKCQGVLRTTGCSRTGCIFCAYGFHCEKGETRFQRLSKTHPRQYEYCLDGGEWIDNPLFDSSILGKDVWNPKKLWAPSTRGLGMKKVFDMCNEIYGKDFMRY